MSVARSASAATSLPKPGALTPVGTGRSRDEIGLCACGRRSSRLDALMIVGRPSSSPADIRAGGHPTGSRSLTQPRQNFQSGIAVGRLHPDLFLERQNGLDGIAAGAAVDAIGFEAVLVEAALDFLDLFQRRRPLAA